MRGITLLEMLLVLAIGASIVILGIQQYSKWRMQSDVVTIQKNVDVLFQAMTHYYQANCKDQREKAGEMTAPGKLSPSWLGFNPTPVTITVDELKTMGFLAADNLNPIPIVANYFLQFVPVFPTMHYSQGEMTEIVKKNSVILWHIQVAVQLNTAAYLFKDLLNADCLSTLQNGKPIPCKDNPSGYNVLIWARLPSLSSTVFTGLETSVMTSKGFNREYMNNDFYAYGYNDYNWNNTTTYYETYLCGG